MEIKLNIDEARLLKLVIDGTSEKEISKEFITRIKCDVREHLDNQLRTITKEQVAKALSVGIIGEILKNELRPRLVRFLKETLDDLDLSDLLVDLISDNITFKGTVDIKK